MKYSICLEPVLKEMDFYDRIQAVAEMGFNGIEFWDPTGLDMKKIGRLSSRHNITVVGCCLLDQWTIRADDSINKVKSNLIKTIEYTKDSGCSSFILMTGDSSTKFDTQKNILIENLRHLADIAEKYNVTLLLESLNTRVDHKGYYLDSAYLGYEIVRCVNSNHVKFLFDCYHMQIMEGNLIENISKNIENTGHVHCASVPGRNEIYKGEINYTNVINSLYENGYSGYIGLEYWPTINDTQSLLNSMKYLQGSF